MHAVGNLALVFAEIARAWEVIRHLTIKHLIVAVLGLIRVVNVIVAANWTHFSIEFAHTGLFLTLLVGAFAVWALVSNEFRVLHLLKAVGIVIDNVLEVLCAIGLYVCNAFLVLALFLVASRGAQRLFHMPSRFEAKILAKVFLVFPESKSLILAEGIEIFIHARAVAAVLFRLAHRKQLTPKEGRLFLTIDNSLAIMILSHISRKEAQLGITYWLFLGVGLLDDEVVQAAKDPAVAGFAVSILALDGPKLIVSAFFLAKFVRRPKLVKAWRAELEGVAHHHAVIVAALGFATKLLLAMLVLVVMLVTGASGLAVLLLLVEPLIARQATRTPVFHFHAVILATVEVSAGFSVAIDMLHIVLGVFTEVDGVLVELVVDATNGASHANPPQLGGTLVGYTLVMVFAAVAALLDRDIDSPFTELIAVGVSINEGPIIDDTDSFEVFKFAVLFTAVHLLAGLAVVHALHWHSAVFALVVTPVLLLQEGLVLRGVTGRHEIRILEKAIFVATCFVGFAGLSLAKDDLLQRLVVVLGVAVVLLAVKELVAETTHELGLVAKLEEFLETVPLEALLILAVTLAVMYLILWVFAEMLTILFFIDYLG